MLFCSIQYEGTVNFNFIDSPQESVEQKKIQNKRNKVNICEAMGRFVSMNARTENNDKFVQRRILPVQLLSFVR